MDQLELWTVDPSALTSKPAIPLRSSNATAAEGSDTRHAVAKASAHAALPATTVAWIISARVGSIERPVLGSMTWLVSGEAPFHRRARRYDVATPPLSSESRVMTPSPDGCSTSIVHPCSWSGEPIQRRSPPMLTSAPLAPESMRNFATRSAANPLPIPPTSMDLDESPKVVTGLSDSLFSVGKE